MKSVQSKIFIFIILFIIFSISFAGIYYYKEIKNKIPKSAKFVMLIEENIVFNQGKNINVIKFGEG